MNRPRRRDPSGELTGDEADEYFGLADSEIEARLTPIREEYSRSFRTLVRRAPWQDQDIIEAAEKACQILERQARVIWAALKRAVDALPAGKQVTAPELMRRFNRWFEPERDQVLAMANTLLRATPGRDFATEIRDTLASIQGQLKADAGYAASESSTRPAPSRVQRFWMAAQQHPIMFTSTIVAGLVISLNNVSTALDHIVLLSSKLLEWLKHL